MSSGVWTEIMMVEEHESGQRQDILLPVFSSAPSLAPFPTMPLILKHFDGFRVWTMRDMLDSDYWMVRDIKLYSNLDCTGTNHNDGTPFSSEYATNDNYNGNPEYAFDTDDGTYWQGRPNENGEYWVGMEFDNTREVLCLSYLDHGLYRHNNYGAKKFKIEGREMSSGVWTEIMMVEEHESGQRQDILLPVFSSAPSLAPFPTMPLILKHFDGFRVWTMRDMLDSDYWMVRDIKLYSNLDCTGTNHNDGTPFSSEYATNDNYNGNPEYAFDTDDSTYW